MTDHDQHADDEHEHHHHAPITYEEEVADFRARKDAFFAEHPGSPLPAGDREGFTGLPYYPIDERYRLEDLTLEAYAGDEPSHFQIPTSDGRLRPAHRAGTLSFDLDGERRRLTGYVLDEGDPHKLFVPFLDATSGSETYGAGRYLDLEPEDDGTYALDFNLAYHPSCVYDARFSCPLTPAENRLPIRVEAGERLAEAAPEG
jgi:uncharacterized protein (DUF1684 family)